MAQLQAMKKPLSAPFIKKIQAVSHCSYIRVSKKVPEKCLVENAQTALFSSVRSQTIYFKTIFTLAHLKTYVH